MMRLSGKIRQTLLCTLPLFLLMGCADTTGPAKTAAPANQPAKKAPVKEASAKKAKKTEKPDTILSYERPGAAPGDVLLEVRDGRPRPVLRRFAKKLERRGFTIKVNDLDRRLLIAEKVMKPDEMVDCGFLSGTLLSGKKKRVPATRERIQFKSRQNENSRVSGRLLDGTGRLVISAKRVNGESSEITSKAYFVVVKTETDANGLPLNREVMHFESGKTGSFSKGTTCQSNGKLEGLLLASN